MNVMTSDQLVDLRRRLTMNASVSHLMQTTPSYRLP